MEDEQDEEDEDEQQLEEPEVTTTQVIEYFGNMLLNIYIYIILFRLDHQLENLEDVFEKKGKWLNDRRLKTL